MKYTRNDIYEDFIELKQPSLGKDKEICRQNTFQKF